MAFLEKLKLFTEGFIEGWNENVAKPGERGEVVDFTGDEETSLNDIPEPFDTFDMTHSLYYSSRDDYQ